MILYVSSLTQITKVLDCIELEDGSFVLESDPFTSAKFQASPAGRALRLAPPADGRLAVDDVAVHHVLQSTDLHWQEHNCVYATKTRE